MILRSPKDREYYYGTGEHAGNPNAIAKRQKTPPHARFVAANIGRVPRVRERNEPTRGWPRR